MSQVVVWDVTQSSTKTRRSFARICLNGLALCGLLIGVLVLVLFIALCAYFVKIA